METLKYAGSKLGSPESIKKIRKFNDLSTKELGEMLGVSHRTVEGWEQGRPISKKIISSLKILIERSA